MAEHSILDNLAGMASGQKGPGSLTYDIPDLDRMMDAVAAMYEADGHTPCEPSVSACACHIRHIERVTVSRRGVPCREHKGSLIPLRGEALDPDFFAPLLSAEDYDRIDSHYL